MLTSFRQQFPTSSRLTHRWETREALLRGSLPPPSQPPDGGAPRGARPGRQDGTAEASAAAPGPVPDARGPAKRKQVLTAIQACHNVLNKSQKVISIHIYGIGSFDDDIHYI